jgi:hypothetical protein
VADAAVCYSYSPAGSLWNSPPGGAVAVVAYALMSSTGLVVTWNLGPVTMSIAPAERVGGR